MRTDEIIELLKKAKEVRSRGMLFNTKYTVGAGLAKICGFVNQALTLLRMSKDNKGDTPAEDRYGRDVKKLTCGNCEKFKLVSKHGSKPSLDCEKPGYGTLATNNPCDRFEPKPKPLAQYLDEYLRYEIVDVDRELLEQALDAYESTEQVKIRIERV